jgi:hypothetical protein
MDDPGAHQRQSTAAVWPQALINPASTRIVAPKQSPGLTESQQHEFWPASGFFQLQRNARGWLTPTDAYLRLFLARPELALVDESCAAEQALHAALMANPRLPVGTIPLQTLADTDVAANYGHFLAFRDGLIQSGSLEAWYLATLRSGQITVPPLFIDLVVQACLRNLLDETTDAQVARAAELLFRPQRIYSQDGQVLSGDQGVLDLLNETGGLGDMGRLLAQNNAPMREVNLQVLTDANADRYWPQSDRHDFLLDFTHEITNDLSHGLSLTMTRSRSGLKALARVLEAWVAHFLGVEVNISPEQKINDANWRWHIGLDAESSALLNDLYQDRPVETARMQRLVSLFRLSFKNPLEMRPDVAGKPVYLGLAMTANNVVRLKPQNLLLNLPLRHLN